MKPFPSLLQMAVPAPYGSHFARPWWRVEANEYCRVAAERTDGLALTSRIACSGAPMRVCLGQAENRSFPPLKWPRLPAWSRSVSTDQTDENREENRVIRLHTWLAEIDALAPIPFPGWRAGQIWGDANGETVSLTAGVSDGCMVGTAYFEGPRLLQRLPFLLADPCCPHLAPWSAP